MRLQLVAGHIACGSLKQGRNPIYNRLFLNGNALKRLDGDNRRHTDALSGLDRSTQSGAVDVLTDNIRHMLLADGADGKAQLACQSR